MPAPDPSFGWQAAIAALAVIAVTAFLVTWIVTDRLRVPRTPYVVILTALAGVLLVALLAWSGVSGRELLLEDAGWAVLAGLVVAALVTPGVRRLPSGPRASGGRLLPMLAFEGVVYGIAEAILLATLPVLAAWFAFSDLGWTDAGSRRVVAGALAIAAALVVILVHHLGYEEFRGRAGAKMLAGALLGCGLQALAFLLTGNVLAPIVAHIVLHAELILRGVELPPARRSARAGVPV